MYSTKVMDHFRNPQNAGKMEGADAVGQMRSSEDGDLVYIYLKVRGDKIEDISFQAFGCGAAIASSSMTTVLAKGKTLDEGMQITRESVAEALDGLPPKKMLCSNLAPDALRDAIQNYRKAKE